MEVQTSYVGRYMTTLVERLRRREGVGNAGVLVFSGPVARGEMGRECICLFTADEKQRWSSQGNLRREAEWSVEGVVWVQMANSPDAEDSIRAVRDRAYELLGEVETMLREDLEGITVEDDEGEPMARESELRDARLDQGAMETDRVAVISFFIDAKKSLIRTGGG